MISGVKTSRFFQAHSPAFLSPLTGDNGALRPMVKGKFLYVGEEKLWLRGVTYGPFRPTADGCEYHDPARVDQDFADMAQHGFNAIRTYATPPRWLLDAAHQHGLYVMVGLPWEQHVTYLDDSERLRDIEARVRVGVRACAGHPALLCYVIGNEIPASIVRWSGRRRTEQFLGRLYRAAKAEDPDGLVTYVNYPSTEYLQLPFLDLLCFNVYLESRQRLESYLLRLQNLAGERPLLMGEVGLDSRRHGETMQAQVLAWQVSTAFACGCAGTFVFAWTDEWYRGGYDITDWDFGLTDRQRGSKPALKAVSRAFAEVPFPADTCWPRVSVVVCSYNGARTIRKCLEALQQLDYPDYEVIVVDDGSTDTTADIAQEYEVRLIRTENRGLSSARNTGLDAATSELVAYIDDDAYPDPHWLTYLAATFLRTSHAGVGGPNIAPPGDGLIAECIANAPGGPIHVLISDQEAEHIPGCNMAFRKTALQAVGGFDPQFRSAGDDVDVCWRLQQSGGSLGFSAAAVVWHHRRNSIQAYWKQQRGYGRAEAMLERKWPEKYNSTGHLTWSGRLYGRGLTHILGQVWRVYYGVWGSAPFQSLYQPAVGVLQSLPLMPEWYLVIAMLAALSALGVFWAPLLWGLPVLLLVVGVSVVQAGCSASQAIFTRNPWSGSERLTLYLLTTCLHLLQPVARLWGRLRHGLTPWRRYGISSFALPRPRRGAIWSETWRAPEQWLESIEAALRAQGTRVIRGGGSDRWDLQLHGGGCGTVRVRMAIEEHGAGKQLVRLYAWPRGSVPAFGLSVVLLTVALLAGIQHAWGVCIVLGLGAVLCSLRICLDCASATAAYLHALKYPGVQARGSDSRNF